MNLSDNVRFRLLASGMHLLVSLAVAVAVAMLTLLLWYPGAFGSIAGGRRLFLIVLGVDVVMGPLLTAVVFDRRKPRRELLRDLSAIAVLQLAALAYGLSTVYRARPVALVLEGDRFRMVAAVDVRKDELGAASPEYRRLPLDGPWILGTRAARAGDERLQSIELALKGYDIGQRPSFWQPYDKSRGAALAASRPMDVLLDRYPQARPQIEKALHDARLARQDARFVPMVARGDWVAILDAHGDVAGYAPFDGFF